MIQRRVTVSVSVSNLLAWRTRIMRVSPKASLTFRTPFGR